MASEAFLAVAGLGITSPRDLWQRMAAVQAFTHHVDAASLIATDKRIANLLQRQVPATVDPARFTDEAERQLWAAIEANGRRVREYIARHDYPSALAALSELRAPVDRFFADVLVMAEDPAVRDNRLGLLGALRTTFSAIADLSQLAARVGAQ